MSHEAVEKVPLPTDEKVEPYFIINTDGSYQYTTNQLYSYIWSLVQRKKIENFPAEIKTPIKDYPATVFYLKPYKISVVIHTINTIDRETNQLGEALVVVVGNGRFSGQNTDILIEESMCFYFNFESAVAKACQMITQFWHGAFSLEVDFTDLGLNRIESFSLN